jgi:hypothetical protein
MNVLCSLVAFAAFSSAAVCYVCVPCFLQPLAVTRPLCMAACGLLVVVLLFGLFPLALSLPHFTRAALLAATDQPLSAPLWGLTWTLDDGA